jgi:DNA-binding transcriptional LysR family regulator
MVPYERRISLMDIKMLDYVVMIANCGSISKAAEKLYVTQSGLNQQLIKLEKSLGIKLFERDHHHLQITRAGEIFVRNAAQMLQLQRNTFMQLNELKQDIAGEISLGLTHEHGIDLFTAVYPAFHERYPNIRLRLQEQIVAEQYRMLTQGYLDVGIVMASKAAIDAHKQLASQEIYREDLLLGVPKTHPMAARAIPISSGRPLRVVDLGLFRKDPFALIFSSSTMRTEIIDPLFEKCGFQPHIMFETSVNSAIAQLVSKGLCCTILPHSRVMASLYRDQCAWFRLLENPCWSVSYVYRRDFRISSNLRYFLDLGRRYGLEKEAAFEVQSPGYIRADAS